MNSFKLNLNVIQQFIFANKLTEQVSYSEIKNIFDESNQYLENGEKGRDEYLTGNEVPTFHRLLKEKSSKFYGYIGRLMNSITVDENNETSLVKCNKTEEQRKMYEDNLNKAKEIIEQNQSFLELSDEEVNYMKNAVLVSEKNGSARYDMESNAILFNLNDGISVPDTSSLVKVLLHEVTHAMIKSGKPTDEEESVCEKRALTLAYKLYKNGKINDFKIINGLNKSLSDLDKPEKIDNFVSRWIEMMNRAKLQQQSF